MIMNEEMKILEREVLENEFSDDGKLQELITLKNEILKENQDQYRKNLNNLVMLKSEKEELVEKFLQQFNDLQRNLDGILKQLTFKNNEHESLMKLSENLQSDMNDQLKKKDDKNNLIKISQKEFDEKIAKIEWDFKLYQLISRIQWKMDDDINHFSGIMFNKKESKTWMKPFSLDKQSYSATFISNYLWDMMENDF